jgi:two-component system alkaline phosphatase synthesis response regulator PhoP
MIKIVALYDDTDYLNLIGGILKVAGFQFIGATSREQAWSTLQNSPIDLLIMDWMISDSERWEEIYDKMKVDSSLSKIGVIVTTPRHPDSRNIWVNGDHYLARPFAPAHLLTKVRQVLDNYDKEFPTLAEMEEQFGKNRSSLKAKYSWSDEVLEEYRQHLLHEAEYIKVTGK